MSLCSYVKKKYVFMFFCLNPKIMSKRSSLPGVGRVSRSDGRVRTACTPSDLAKLGLVPLIYEDS